MNSLPDREARTAESPSILSKAFDLLRAFDSSDRVMTLSDLARASGLPKSTVHRLIARLIDLDAVEQHRSGYQLSVGLLRIATNTPAGSMRDLAIPHLAALHRWSGETVHLGVLRGYAVVYLDKVARTDDPNTLSAGARMPANCTAIGKALLAWEDLENLAAHMPSPIPVMTQHSVACVEDLIIELRRIRTVGVAHENNEARPGVGCVAAPIVVYGFAVGAISLAHHADVDTAPKLENALRDTTAQIGKEIAEQLPLGRAHWFPRGP